MLRFIGLLFFLLVGAPLSFAGEVIWDPVPLCVKGEGSESTYCGEGFQQIQTIAWARSKDNIAYLATDQSQIYKSTDFGLSWTPYNSGFDANGARSIGVDPTDESVVVACGFVGKFHDKGKALKKRIQGIFLSEDGGMSWGLVHKTDFFKQYSRGQLVVFDPVSHDGSRCQKVYVGSHSEGLLVSNDGGRKWSVATTPPSAIVDIAVAPGGGGLLVATEGALYDYKDENLKRVGNGLPSPPRSIAVAAGGAIYAAVGKDGVYTSDDGGRTFRKTSSGLPWGSDISEVEVSPVDSKLVYCKSEKSRDKGIYRSQDGGEHWEKPEYVDRVKATPLGVGLWRNGPIAPHPRIRNLALFGANGKDTLLRTTDGGKEWAYSASGFSGGRVVDSAFTGSGDIYFALTDFGVWHGSVNSRYFNRLRTGPGLKGLYSSGSVAVQGKTIVASLGTWQKKKLIISFDKGKGWMQPNVDPQRFDYIGFHPNKVSVIYAGNYRSNDGGRRWRKLKYPVLEISPVDGDVVYSVRSAGKGSEIIVSNDQGANWETYSLNLPVGPRQIRDIKASPHRAGEVWIACPKGGLLVEGKMKKTVYLGKAFPDELRGYGYVMSIGFHPEDVNTVYLGLWAPSIGNGKGVYRTEDKGKSWHAYNGTMLSRNVFSIKANESDGYLYIGTSAGTYRTKY